MTNYSIGDCVELKSDYRLSGFVIPKGTRFEIEGFTARHVLASSFSLERKYLLSPIGDDPFQIPTSMIRGVE